MFYSTSRLCGNRPLFMQSVKCVLVNAAILIYGILVLCASEGKGGARGERLCLKPLLDELQITFNREFQFFNKNNRLFNTFYYISIYFAALNLISNKL